MKRLKLVTGIMLTVALLFALNGCSATDKNSSDTNTGNTDSVQENSDIADNKERPQRPEGTNYTGKITTIEGDTITVVLSEQFAMGGRGENILDGEVPEFKENFGGSMPDGFNPENSELPEGMTPPENTNFEKGEKPEGFGSPDKGFVNIDNLTFTGETMELTVSDITEITINGETATTEELSVDDIIMFSVEENTVKSINVFNITSEE